MADIFFSYAKSDRAKVEPIVALLQSDGWEVWWDKRIGSGEQWDEVVEREVKAAKCVVVVWSPESISSRWVRSEASVGVERKVLVPITINGTTPPLAFKLIQATDLSNWDNNTDSEEAISLLSAIRRTVGAPPPIPDPARADFFVDIKPERFEPAGTVSPKVPSIPFGKLQLAAALSAFAVLAALGAAWAGWFSLDRKFDHGEKFRDCWACPAMVAIAGNQFIMGADENTSAKWEGPKHAVSIRGMLGVGRYEVTNQEYVAFVNAMLRNNQYDQGWVLTDRESSESSLLFRLRTVVVLAGHENHPVAGVSWRGARAYVEWLSSETGRPYRLPTEAEWEYAARSGTTSNYFFGSDHLKLCEYGNVPDLARLQKHSNWAVVNCNDGYPESAPIGRFSPNAFGLHDMLGNVWEWVEDCWHDTYNGAPTDGSARTSGGDCSKRVIRGGSFDNFSFSGAAARFTASPNDRVMSVGFRVVRN